MFNLAIDSNVKSWGSVATADGHRDSLADNGGKRVRAVAARPVAMIRTEQLWLAVEPVDLRLGIDGLSLKVQQAWGRSPMWKPLSVERY